MLTFLLLCGGHVVPFEDKVAHSFNVLGFLHPLQRRLLALDLLVKPHSSFSSLTSALVKDRSVEG